MDKFLSLVYEYFLSFVHGYVSISGTWIRFYHWYMSTFLFLVHEYFHFWFMDTFLFMIYGHVSVLDI